MIHVTLRNGRTLLFDDTEEVTVACWVSDCGEYWEGGVSGPAQEVLVPEVYVYSCDSDPQPPEDCMRSKIARVRHVAEPHQVS